MKKWLAGIGFVIAVAIACIYIFISRELVVTSLSLVQCNPQAVFREVGHSGNWAVWWPGGEKGGYRYAGDVFSVTGSSYPLTEVTIIHNGMEIKSRISVLSLSNKDSAAVYWQCSLNAGATPWQRLRQYISAKAIRGNMNAVLSRFRPFVENEKNIYGMSVGEASTKDTLLVVTKSYLRNYPSTGDIYNLLGKLREYISYEGAMEKGYPIANVTPGTDSGFQLMTAIPIDRVLPGKGPIFFRRMVPAKFLVAEVKGGDHSIRAAFGHLQEYIADHQRMVMAIPFQTIVTDRMKEPDSAKWSTWIYCPIF